MAMLNNQRVYSNILTYFNIIWFSVINWDDQRICLLCKRVETTNKSWFRAQRCLDQEPFRWYFQVIRVPPPQKENNNLHGHGSSLPPLKKKKQKWPHIGPPFWMPVLQVEVISRSSRPWFSWSPWTLATPRWLETSRPSRPHRAWILSAWWPPKCQARGWPGGKKMETAWSPNPKTMWNMNNEWTWYSMLLSIRKCSRVSC